MHYCCAICHRPPGVLCWIDPRNELQMLNRRRTFRRFCSRVCQDLYYTLKKEGIEMNDFEVEQCAKAAVLSPLADYVATIGVNTPLERYSKTDITGLIDTVLKAYHDALKALYQNGVPF